GGGRRDHARPAPGGLRRARRGIRRRPGPQALHPDALPRDVRGIGADLHHAPARVPGRRPQGPQRHAVGRAGADAAAAVPRSDARGRAERVLRPRADRLARLRLGPQRAGRVGRPHARHHQPAARGRLVRRRGRRRGAAVRRPGHRRVSHAGEDVAMSGFADYEAYDARGLAGLVRQGKVTPVELLDAAIARVEARNAKVNAVTMPLYDYARKAIADGLPDGPFRGVPFLMKDLTASIAGVRTMRGSRFFSDTPPAAADSEHVVRLRRAGLVIFGRTNTCELGLSLTW